MENFTENQQKSLLDLARNAIFARFENKEIEKQPKDKVFLEKRGVFVSLHKNGGLRGCIGNIEPIKPIWRAVAENAIAAAFEDPRFLPVEKSEMDSINIEISVLSALKKTKANEIKPGVDGVILKYNGRQSTYLPQVWSHFKTKQEFLNGLSEKAGLPKDAWQDEQAKLYSYQTQTFSE